MLMRFDIIFILITRNVHLSIWIRDLFVTILTTSKQFVTSSISNMINMLEQIESPLTKSCQITNIVLRNILCCYVTNQRNILDDCMNHCSSDTSNKYCGIISTIFEKHSKISQIYLFNSWIFQVTNETSQVVSSILTQQLQRWVVNSNTTNKWRTQLSDKRTQWIICKILRNDYKMCLNQQ